MRREKKERRGNEEGRDVSVPFFFSHAVLQQLPSPWESRGSFAAHAISGKRGSELRGVQHTIGGAQC